MNLHTIDGYWRSFKKAYKITDGKLLNNYPQVEWDKVKR